jgi:hypothetical protein
VFAAAERPPAERRGQSYWGGPSRLTGKRARSNHRRYDRRHRSYTTFGIGGATQYLPTDRVIDGLDQTALLMNGDTHGRRDYEFIYQGSTLAATIWKQYKRTWGGGGTSASGVSAAFYDLYLDPREETPLLLQLSHFYEPTVDLRTLPFNVLEIIDDMDRLPFDLRTDNDMDQ